MNEHHELSTIDLEERPDSGWRRRLFIIVFEADTKFGKFFDVCLLWAIIISIFAVILESDKSIQAQYGDILFAIEWIITVFFTIEYVMRLIIIKHPTKYAFSFYGVIDLLATLPAYIALIVPQSQYLMVIRVLRLLRVFRILKLIKFVTAAQVLGSALYESRYKIGIFFGVVLSLVLVMGTGMYIVEGEQSGFTSIAQSMYWTIVTMTTVGYGDIVPSTTMGKFLASFMMLIGYAIIAVPTGIVTAELNNAERQSHHHECPRCGTENEDDNNYCFKCGEKFS